MSSDTGSTTPVPKIQQTTPPIVGRDAELSLLGTRIEQLKREQGGAVFLVGESGVGKTRLLKEAVLLAGRAGFTGLLVGCRGSEQVPLLPVAYLLRGLLSVDTSLPPAVRARRVQQRLNDLSLNQHTAVVTDLINQVGSSKLPFNPDQTVDANIPAIATATVDIIRQLAAGEKPVVAAFDDIDQAGPDLQAVLVRLLANLPDLPVVVLGALARTGTFPLSGAGGVLELAPLNQQETAELIGGLLADNPDPEFGEMVWNLTDGSPLLVRMLIEDLSEDSRLQARPQGIHLVDGGTMQGLMQIVRRHLKQLDDADTAVLRALAVLGSGSPIAQIETLLPGGENGRLSALSAGGWVERLPDTDRFRYVNRITQDMVYSGMSPHERSVFHKRAGEYFYNTSLMGDRLFTTQAIAHYRLAGDSSGALEALDLAVREARSHNDEEAIIRLLQTGIAITSASPAASSKRTEFAERLGDIYARRGDYRKAASAYGESGVGQNALRLRGKLGLSLLVFDGVRSSHVLGKITRRVPLDFPGDLRWVLEAGHAWALSLAGSHYNAIRHVRDVLATLGSLSGYGAARTLMRAMLGMVLFYNGDLVDAQPHLDTARQSWEARADQQGVLLINRVLNEAPRSEVTDLLMQILLHPLLIDPMVE